MEETISGKSVGFCFQENICRVLGKLGLPGHFDKFQLQREKNSIWVNFGNTGSVLVEEAFLLYALVRMTKPQLVLDCGTYIGISAMFMAEALRDNCSGRIISIEHNSDTYGVARQVFAQTGYHEIELLHQEIETYHPTESIDFLFLDTETADRVQQFVKLFPDLSSNAWVVFHDAGACKDIDLIEYPYLHFKSIRETRVFHVEKK
jgi:predicted O-methyltransferase YrrM